MSTSSILVVWRKPVPSNGRISHYAVVVKDGKTGETVSTHRTRFLLLLMVYDTKSIGLAIFPEVYRIDHLTLNCHGMGTLYNCRNDLQKKFIHQANRNLTFHVGNLVEGRPYEVSVTAASRTGESIPSRIVSVTPTAKSIIITRHGY